MGWLTYKPGLVILREKAREILQNRYTLLIFALATQSDGRMIRALQEQWREIHSLTGRHILFIAFYNAHLHEHEIYRYSQQFDPELRQLLGMQPNLVDTDRFMQSMTKESYALAHSLGIPFTDLPCLVFIETHDVNNYGVLRLNSVGDDSLIYILREFITDYLNKPENREYFRTIEIIEQLEQKRTNEIAKLRRIPQDIETANARIKQLRSKLTSERKHITKAVREQLLNNLVSPEKDRLLEVRRLVGPLRKFLQASEEDERDILFKWIREGRADLIHMISLETHLTQLLQYLTDLESGKIEQEIIRLTTKVKRDDLDDQERGDLRIRLRALHAAREAVRSRFLEFIKQNVFFDRDKVQKLFQGLHAEEQALLSVVFGQIDLAYPSRLETEVDSALNIIRGPIENEIMTLEQDLRQLTSGDLERLSNTAIAQITEEIHKLNESIRDSHPDALSVLDRLNRRYSVKRARLSIGTAARENASTIIELLKLIFAR